MLMKENVTTSKLHYAINEGLKHNKHELSITANLATFPSFCFTSRGNLLLIA